jgi:hypothetical protein
LLPTTSQLPSSANFRAKPRMSCTASAARRSPATASPLFQASSAKRTFSIVLASGEGVRAAVAWIVSPGRFIGRACPYVAMDPALDNEHDPMDQDSRTSFPDKGSWEPSQQQTKVPPLGTAAAHHLAGPFPDFLRVDADANVYAAMYEQGRVLAFSSARPSAATAQARSAN